MKETSKPTTRMQPGHLAKCQMCGHLMIVDDKGYAICGDCQKKNRKAVREHDCR